MGTSWIDPHEEPTEVEQAVAERDAEWQEVLRKMQALHMDSMELARKIAYDKGKAEGLREGWEQGRNDGQSPAQGMRGMRAEENPYVPVDPSEAARQRFLTEPVVRAKDSGTCPSCVSGYHESCQPTLNDGSGCDCFHQGHRAEENPYAEPAEEPVRHQLVLPDGWKHGRSPRPSCACGVTMPEGIKTSPQGWFYAHKKLEQG